MATDYKAILKQAKEAPSESLQADKHKSMQSSSQESKKASLHASMDSSKQEVVNLCVRVPKQLRNYWKSEAAKQGIPLAEYIIKGLTEYYGATGSD